MFFHDKPGWGITLRMDLVLVLIAGMAWVTRAAFYRGVAVGAGQMGSRLFGLLRGWEDGWITTIRMVLRTLWQFWGNVLPPSGHSQAISGQSGPMGHYSGYYQPNELPCRERFCDRLFPSALWHPGVLPVG